MKKLLVIGMFLVSTASFARKIDASKVPLVVRSTFSNNFPNIQSVKWEIEKSNYEANFTLGIDKKAALFNAKGEMLENETTISVNQLPPSVISYVQKNYKGANIREAARINMPNGDINYEAEVNKRDLIFDANGNFLKSVKD